MFLLLSPTSSSFSSKDLSRCWGMTSLKPFCRARNWASMPCRKRQFTYNLQGACERSEWGKQSVCCKYRSSSVPRNSFRDGLEWQRSRIKTRIHGSENWACWPDILLLSVLCDWETLAVGLELVLDDFSVGIVLDTESVVQDAGDVIVPEEVREREATVRISSQLLQTLFLFISPSFLLGFDPTKWRHGNLQLNKYTVFI